MDRFKDKTVIVTGAGSGIGKSTAIRLDAEGAQLLIIDINEEQLDNLVAALNDKEAGKINNLIEEVSDSSFIINKCIYTIVIVW